MLKKSLCIIISLVVVLSINSYVFAESIKDLKQEKNEITQKTEDAKDKLGEVQDEMSDNLKQVQELNDKIGGYEDEIKSLEGQINTLQKNIKDLQSKLSVAQQNYDKQKKLLEDRLVVMYMSGDTTYLDVLLSSKNITEFISNYYLVSEVTKCDTELLNEIEKNKNEIEAAKKSIEKQKSEYDSKKKSKENTSNSLQVVKNEKEQQVGKLNEQEKQIQKQIDQYKSDIADVETKIAKATSSGDNTYTQYSGGVMAWPLPGYTTITSSFGMREHPVTGVYKLHTGVDISGSGVSGKNVVAANEGTVVIAGYSNGYGNYIVINHGGGISTLYGHSSQLLVSVGQKVKKGDVIMKVGSTGYSTGAHLHFEVRVNNTPVNPISYITSK